MKTQPSLRSVPAPRRGVSSAAGFTLTEILIAIALIVTVVAMAVTGLSNIYEHERIELAQTFVKSGLDTPLMAYRLHTGTLPTTEQGLHALVSPPEGVTGWSGPYLTTTEVPKDPWRDEYRYANPGTHNTAVRYDAWSLGPDQTDATKDDIGNW